MDKKIHLMRKPNGDTINNLPLNSGVFILLNNLFNKKIIESIVGGCILRNIIPEDSFGGNFILFKKCLSNVNNTLSSDLANSNTCPSFELGLILFASNPFLDNTLMTPKGIFSSTSRGGLEGDIFFIFYAFGGIIKRSKNSFFSEFRKIIFKDFINSNSGSKQFKHLPYHDPCAFEGGCASTDFIVSNNVFVDFNSHENNNNREYLKLSGGKMNNHKEIKYKVRASVNPTSHNKIWLSSGRVPLYDYFRVLRYLNFSLIKNG